ncbi:helix-turn-helix transcriptional regulator [Anatilimnocola sp. NA78]|uniref:helix-turn-helix transcriptional regulator n=1 Tax=Anatilimnocola sp. NA78 TaxID=3415683 RepID=UPI003CE49AFB
MARNAQLIRQHRLLQILEAYRFGRTLDELRDELVELLGIGSLHPRSVRRDLEALQAAGIDIDVSESARGAIWKFGPRARSAVKITASATELIALSLSRDLLYPLAGTPFWQGIESFWNKLQEELPPAVRKHYQEYRQTLYVRGMPAKDYQKQHGMLGSIHRAILEHRVVEIEYQPPGKDVQKRQIEPYAVVFYNNSLYILAAAREIPAGQERIRHLKLDRFLKAVALDEWFQLPADFNLEEHLGQGTGIFSGGKPRDFKIRITARGARWVTEDPWHPQQLVEPQPDGSILLTVKAAHELEIIPRVLSLGSEAELLAPESCRKMIAGVLRQAAAQYGPGS